jgi:hypothetical protein
MRQNLHRKGAKAQRFAKENKSFHPVLIGNWQCAGSQFGIAILNFRFLCGPLRLGAFDEMAAVLEKFVGYGQQ